MRSLAASTSRLLTAMAHPWVTVFGRRWCAFHLMGAVGFALSSCLAIWLTLALGRSTAVTAALVLVAVASFLVLAFARKIVQGEEGLTYYHHEIAILAASAVVLTMMREPLLPYLDVTALSLGMFLLCGRWGCFFVGCCHGRPSRWGVRYGADAVKAGFTRHLEGVRLWPVQLVEAAWVLATVVGGVMLIFQAPAGSALAWYSIVYGWGRFLFELVRGDSARPYRGGFSEAQWTSLVLMSLTTGLEVRGLLPLELWHVAATLALVLTMAAIRASGDPARRINHPRHVEQLAALVSAPRHGMRPGIGDTSLGIRVSASAVVDGGGATEVIAFSGVGAMLPPQKAQQLATLAARLKGVEHGTRMFAGHDGVYHLILPAGARHDVL